MTTAFWQEFFRVQSDKFLLVLLVVILWLFHAPENVIAGVIGCLLGLIQGQRFKLGS